MLLSEKIDNLDLGVPFTARHLQKKVSYFLLHCYPADWTQTEEKSQMSPKIRDTTKFQTEKQSVFLPTFDFENVTHKPPFPHFRTQ